MIYGVLIENLPQLIIQFIALKFNDNNLVNIDYIYIASIIVSMVDIILMFVNVCIWKSAHPTGNAMNTSHMKGVGYVEMTDK